ncbi:MAG TPA: hypothetical protein VMU99_04995 [Acidimicrobiales bacterium]|nr:hypothetical protein [Acidimicrobiales bacterium]
MKDAHARFLEYLQRWWAAQLGATGDAHTWTNGRDTHALAAQFRRDPQFEVAQAGLLHRRLSPFEARDAVDHLDPLPNVTDAELLTDALVRASSTARRVRTTTAAGAVITISALMLRRALRKRS